MKDLLYKPGDVIMIRPDLKEGDYPVLYGSDEGGTLFCNDEMETYAGETDEIECYDGGWAGESYYRLKSHGWQWTESMFEDPNECMCSSLL